MISSKKKLIVFEDQYINSITNFDKKKFELFFVNPAAYFNNLNNIKTNPNFFGEDFNEYIKNNFNSFSETHKKTLDNINELNLDEISKETLTNLAIPILSVYFFARFNLKKTNYYFIHENKILPVNKNTFKIYLKKFLLHQKQLIFLKNKEIKQFFSWIIFFINKIIFKFLKNKNYILIQDSSYGFKNLILNNKKKIFLKFNYLNKFNIVQTLFSIYKFIFKKELFISLSIPILKNRKEILENDLNIFDHLDHDLSVITNKPLNHILTYLNILNKNFHHYVFNNINPDLSLFHNLKWADELIFSQTNVKNNCYLVSHASHPLPNNHISYFFLKDLSKGLLYSKFASKFLLQSSNALESFIHFKYPIEKSLKIEPFVWGYKKLNNFSINKNIGCTTLLHASTFKINSFRPYIYENANIYYLKLKKLCDLVSISPKLKLIIRPCVNKDFTNENFIKLLKNYNSKNILISKNQSFIEDLQISDILISFSSTTIEEAIYLNKRVILLSGKDEHRHFNINRTLQTMNIFKIDANNFNLKIDKLKNAKIMHVDEDCNLDINKIINEK